MIVVMEAGNRLEISKAIRSYREMGLVNFKKVLTVPSSERISALSVNDDGRGRVSAVISASLTSAFSNINLRIGLSDDQIFELAEMIIDQSSEDNLSLEDVLLFLGDLVMGKAGKIYDRMDIPTFFELFEIYRQKRHEAVLDVRYEQHANYKSHGSQERSSEDNREKDAMREAMSDHLKHLYNDKANT